MTKLLHIDEIQSFRRIRNFSADQINNKVIETVKALNEKTQLEPFIRSCISDLNDTPHGPMEIVDILTTKLRIKGEPKYSAFILKGKSFKAIKGQDVSHQIYRLKKINGLEVAVFGYTGNLLDQAQEEFVSTCHEIGCYYSVWDSLELARLLVSEGFICPKDGEIIEGGQCDCGYLPERIELNLFQERALKELTTSHKLNQRKGLVVLPTGVGKTKIAALDVKSVNPERTLYLAHTDEILDGAEREFVSQLSRDLVNRIEHKKDFKNLNKINLATIQLISRNLKHFDPLAFKYLIVDEFHHAAANSYKKTIDYFASEFLLGLTATPFRGDSQDIALLCDNNYLISVELREAIEAGVLSPYHYYGCFDDVDYSKIKHKGKNYDVKDLEKSLLIPKRDNAIIEKWKELANNKSTIGFCCTQKHAERAAEAFCKSGINAKVYLAYTQNRDSILKEFENGEIKVLFTVDVLNEGVDFPFVECLLFLRPTESKRIFLQQLGRGLRRFSGKSKTIVLDFIGNFTNAYRIVNYLDLRNTDSESHDFVSLKYKTTKELFSLPVGCEINFDEKVIDIFCSQIKLDLRTINRFTITRILVQQYIGLCEKLGKRASWKDLDRYCVLHSEIYKILFGNMENLLKIVEDDLRRLNV